MFDFDVWFGWLLCICLFRVCFLLLAYGGLNVCGFVVSLVVCFYFWFRCFGLFALFVYWQWFWVLLRCCLLFLLDFSLFCLICLCLLLLLVIVVVWLIALRYLVVFDLVGEFAAALCLFIVLCWWLFVVLAGLVSLYLYLVLCWCLVCVLLWWFLVCLNVLFDYGGFSVCLLFVASWLYYFCVNYGFFVCV